MDLQGHVALVTGGSRGIGKGFARGLASAGCRVVLTSRSPERAAAVAAELSTSPGHVVGVAADVTDEDDAARIVANVEDDIGPISLLVNNAGMLQAAGPVGLVDPSLWWREVEVNLRGPFLYSSAVLPAMRARRAGRIINVASDAGLGSLPNESAYNVGKTALIRLSETMAEETAADGITVIALQPGYIRTEMTQFIADAPEMGEHLPAIQQHFRNLFAAEEDTPLDRAVQMLIKIAEGEADDLSGCYIESDDDLVALTRAVGGQADRRRLRLVWEDPLAFRE